MCEVNKRRFRCTCASRYTGHRCQFEVTQSQLTALPVAETPSPPPQVTQPPLSPPQETQLSDASRRWHLQLSIGLAANEDTLCIKPMLTPSRGYLYRDDIYRFLCVCVYLCVLNVNTRLHAGFMFWEFFFFFFLEFLNLIITLCYSRNYLLYTTRISLPCWA